MRRALAALLLILPGCSAFEFLTDNCTQESVEVNWSATIVRNGTPSTVALFDRVSPTNIPFDTFVLLRSALVTGQGDATPLSVMWTVSAFATNGGYISLSHTVPRSPGTTEQVQSTFDGGGWGLQPFNSTNAPVVSVRADNFVATSASGTITTVNATPLILRVDITVRNAAGETIRISGEPRFRYRTDRISCS